MNFIKNLRLLLFGFRYTPLHPQWFAYRYERMRYKLVGQLAKGQVLDIGCGRQTLCAYLKPSTTYIGLDSLETGIALYNSRPNIIGDAGKLPFHDQTFDTVVLLEILEHLPDPTTAVQEARRILKKGGILIFSAPFLYPIHDAPKDYQRWTRHGLEQLAGVSGLIIRDFINMGNPIETGVLLYNLSLAWLTLHAPNIARLPLFLLSVMTIPALNMIGFTLSLLLKRIGSTPFAIGYLLVIQEESE